MTNLTLPQDISDQIDALEQYYQNYAAESARPEHQSRGLKRLGELFGGSSRFANDTMHTQFYEGVQARVAQLAAQIAALEPSEAAEAAGRAVAIVLNPIPQQDRDVAGWMRFAAEPLCQPLLPYLERERLQAIYDSYNRIYPKRLQFPAQVQLRKAMEQLLGR